MLLILFKPPLAHFLSLNSSTSSRRIYGPVIAMGIGSPSWFRVMEDVVWLFDENLVYWNPIPMTTISITT